MKKANSLRLMVFILLTLFLVFAGFNSFCNAPLHTELIKKIADFEAVEMGHHLTPPFFRHDRTARQLPVEFTRTAEKAKDSFGHEKIKFFVPDGETVCSSDRADVGILSKNSYFYDFDAKGGIYTGQTRLMNGSIERWPA